jgi:hypothetical protein
MLMLTQILTHTPTWVFGLFFALLAYGLKQLKSQTASLVRMSAMPLAMVGLSIYGVASAFGSHAMALVVWPLAAVATATLIASRQVPAGVSYDAAKRQFSLPGSAVPLALMMGIFFTKYAVGVSLAMVPQLAQLDGFVLTVTAIYGAFSGLFLGRAIRLWRLAHRGHAMVAA